MKTYKFSAIVCSLVVLFGSSVTANQSFPLFPWKMEKMNPGVDPAWYSVRISDNQSKFIYLPDGSTSLTGKWSNAKLHFFSDEVSPEEISAFLPVICEARGVAPSNVQFTKGRGLSARKGGMFVKFAC